MKLFSSIWGSPVQSSTSCPNCGEGMEKGTCKSCFYKDPVVFRMTKKRIRAFTGRQR